MDFLELARRRRSVRKFTERKIDPQTVEQLLDATFTAPSSKNTRSTRIAVCDNPQALGVVAQMRSRGAAFVRDAPLAFFIMGDDTATDLWRENCAISATMLQLAAESLGLGSCWVQVYGRPHSDDDPQGQSAEEFLRENIAALPPFPIMCVVAVGYPQARPEPHTPADNSDKVWYL